MYASGRLLIEANKDSEVPSSHMLVRALIEGVSRMHTLSGLSPLLRELTAGWLFVANLRVSRNFIRLFRAG